MKITNLKLKKRLNDQKFLVGLLRTIPSTFVRPVQRLHLTEGHRLNLFHHLPYGNRNTLLLFRTLEMFVGLLSQHLASIVAQTAVILLTFLFKTHQEIQARFSRSLRLRFKLFQLLPAIILHLQHSHSFVKSAVLEVSAGTIRTVTIDVITASHLQSSQMFSNGSQMGSYQVRKWVALSFDRKIYNQSVKGKKIIE